MEGKGSNLLISVWRAVCKKNKQVRSSMVYPIVGPCGEGGCLKSIRASANGLLCDYHVPFPLSTKLESLRGRDSVYLLAQ